MNVLKLAAALTLDGSRFKAGLKEADVSSKRFAGNIGSALKGQLAAAFGGAALVSMVKQTLQETAALKDMAEQSQMTTDEVQRLKAAAEDSGLTFEDLYAAQTKFAKQRREAAEGNKELRAEFEKFGMTLEDLNNPSLGFVDFLGKAAKALDGMNMRERATATAELADMLGKVGPKLQGFLQALQEAKDTPLVSKRTIETLDLLEAALNKVERKVKGLVAESFVGLFNPDSLKQFIRSLGALGGVPGMLLAKKLIPEEEGMRPALGDLRQSEQDGEQAPLFTDKSAIKEAEAAQKQAGDAAIKAAKERADLEKEIADYNFKQLSAKEQQAVIEERLRAIVEAARAKQQAGRFDPEADTTIDAEKKAALELLGQMPQQQKGGDQSSLARVGQWQGINYQNKSESEVVKAAKALLDPAKRTAEATETLAKQKPKTINAGIR